MATRVRKPMLMWCEVTIQSMALCTTNTDPSATSSGAFLTAEVSTRAWPACN